MSGTTQSAPRHLNTAFHRAMIAGLFTLASSGTINAAIPNFIGPVQHLPDVKSALQLACAHPNTPFDNGHYIYQSFDGETAMRFLISDIEAHYSNASPSTPFQITPDQIRCVS